MTYVVTARGGEKGRKTAKIADLPPPDHMGYGGRGNAHDAASTVPVATSINICRSPNAAALTTELVLRQIRIFAGLRLPPVPGPVGVRRLRSSEPGPVWFCTLIRTAFRRK